MKPIAAFALCILLLAAGVARGDDWLSRQKKFYELADKSATNQLLADLRQRYPTFDARLRAIALLRVGTPYKLGCLGEEKGRDRGPLFRLDQADCTVLVLTTSALAHAADYDGARAMMKLLNYYPVAPGKDPVAYENRVHFTCDRLLTSRYFKDVTASLLPPDALRQVTLTLNRKADGSKLLPVPFEKKVTMRYIPAAAVDGSVLEKLPNSAGVAFVRLKNVPKGLLVGHEGLILDRRNLVHADSVSGHVRKVDLVEYLRKNADYFDGAIFYQILE